MSKVKTRSNKLSPGVDEGFVIADFATIVQKLENIKEDDSGFQVLASAVKMLPTPMTEMTKYGKNQERMHGELINANQSLSETLDTLIAELNSCK